MLTSRETEVLALVADGQSLAEVGASLYLSRATVKNHCANVRAKYGVQSTLEAVAIAVREGHLVLPEAPPEPSRRDRSIPATVRRESAQRVEGEKLAGVAPVATLRLPMVRGEGRREAILASLRREGLIGGAQD